MLSCAASALAIGLGSTTAAAMPTDDAGDAGAAVTAFTGTPDAPGAASTLASCTFVQRVDYAHISHTSSYLAVQSHGNWGNVNCAYSQAVVTTRVLKRNVVGIYVGVGVDGVATLPPSTHLGSANRVTAHYPCSGSATHTFKSFTDVDVVGIADLPNRQYSPARELGCN